MVRRTALKGYRVAPVFTPDDLAELMDARLVIEPANARLACSRRRRGSPSWRKRSPTSRPRPGARHSPNSAPTWKLTRRFHRLIAEQTGNQFMVAAYAALGGQVQRFRLFGGVGVTDAETPSPNTSLLDALADGRPGDCAAAMAEHVEGSGPRHRRRPIRLNQARAFPARQVAAVRTAQHRHYPVMRRLPALPVSRPPPPFGPASWGFDTTRNSETVTLTTTLRIVDPIGNRIPQGSERHGLHSRKLAHHRGPAAVPGQDAAGVHINDADARRGSRCSRRSRMPDSPTQTSPTAGFAPAI